MSPLSCDARGRIRAIAFGISGQRCHADSLARAGGHGPCKQIEPGPLARYTPGIVRVLDYRVESTTRWADDKQGNRWSGYCGSWSQRDHGT